MHRIARRRTSLLIAILAVALLAATQVTAREGAARPGADREAVTPAVVNADTVDGRHAVGTATKLEERAGVLVATNAAGYPPADIVRKARDADTLDGLDSTVFPRAPALKSSAGTVNEADNPVHWYQLKGVPAAFANGRDDAGVTWMTIAVSTGSIAQGGALTYISSSWPRSSFVRFRVMPTDIDACPELGVRWTSLPWRRA